MFVLCYDGAFYENVPEVMRRLGPWQKKRCGAVEASKPEYRLALARDGLAASRPVVAHLCPLWQRRADHKPPEQFAGTALTASATSIVTAGGAVREQATAPCLRSIKHSGCFLVGPSLTASMEQ